MRELLSSYYVKGIKTAVQLGQFVRFLYHSKTNYSKRGVSVAASGSTTNRNTTGSIPVKAFFL